MEEGHKRQDLNKNNDDNKNLNALELTREIALHKGQW